MIFSTNFTKRSRKGSVMSLSKEKIQVLETLVKKFKEVYNFELYFCEILGNRWSFIAGDSLSYLPQTRVEITKNLGMIIDDSNIPDKDLENIIAIIKKEILT